MPFTIISANMNLPIPVVGLEIGPDYAFDVNQALGLIDQHDHSPGRGIQITPAGININSDLSFGDNQATNVKAILFQSQTSITTIQSLYVAPGSELSPIQDLWFNDGNGTAIQLTKAGIVNATIASIDGESYAAGTFTWTQAQDSLPTTPANFDIGSVTIRPNVAATTNGVKLNPPSSISSQYDLNLPLVPAVNSFLTLDNTGSMSATIPVSMGITASNIANNTITTNQISLTAGITATQLTPVWNVVEFTSGTGTWTVPAGVNTVFIAGCGGGGGGGSGGGGHSAPGGGGSGGEGVPITIEQLNTTPTSVIPYSIGAAGTGGAQVGNDVGGNSGVNGGTTTFGTLSFFGGSKGLGGQRSTGGGGGAAATSIITNGNTAGGGGNSSGIAAAANNSASQAGGAAGGNAAAGRSGPGGGGGAGAKGAGGAGGDAGLAVNTPGGTGHNGVSFGAGGGGGAGGATASPITNPASVGGAGGNGGGGYIAVMWWGPAV